jgi:hypothetical protein
LAEGRICTNIVLWLWIPAFGPVAKLKYSMSGSLIPMSFIGMGMAYYRLCRAQHLIATISNATIRVWQQTLSRE